MVHPDLIQTAKKELEKEKGKLLVDFHVTNCGDDLELIMTHRKGVDCLEVHHLAWDTFEKATEMAKN